MLGMERGRKERKREGKGREGRKEVKRGERGPHQAFRGTGRGLSEACDGSTIFTARCTLVQSAVL